jgi:hypothetical protein
MHHHATCTMSPIPSTWTDGTLLKMIMEAYPRGHGGSVEDVEGCVSGGSSPGGRHSQTVRLALTHPARDPKAEQNVLSSHTLSLVDFVASAILQGTFTPRRGFSSHEEGVNALTRVVFVDSGTPTGRIGSRVKKKRKVPAQSTTLASCEQFSIKHLAGPWVGTFWVVGAGNLGDF